MARDSYANYADYLNQGSYWPKRDDNVVTETVVIEDMPPQYAAAALAKLLRWTYEEGYPRLNVYDADERVVHVRRTPLGVALMMRALGLYDFARVNEIYGPLYDPQIEKRPPLDDRRQVMVVFSQLVKEQRDSKHADMAISHMADLAEAIVDGMHEDGFTVLQS